MKKRISSFAIFESKQDALDIVKLIENTPEGKDLLALPIKLKPVNTGKVWLEAGFSLAKEAITKDGNRYTHSTYSNGAVYAASTYDTIEETLRSFWISIIRRMSIPGISRKELEDWAGNPRCPAYNKKYTYKEIINLIQSSSKTIGDIREYFKDEYWTKLFSDMDILIKGPDEYREKSYILLDSEHNEAAFLIEKLRERGYNSIYNKKFYNIFKELDDILKIKMRAGGSQKGVKKINESYSKGLVLNVIEEDVKKGSEKIKRAIIRYLKAKSRESIKLIGEGEYLEYLINSFESGIAKKTNAEILNDIKFDIMVSDKDGLELLLSKDFIYLSGNNLRDKIQNMIDSEPTKTSIMLKSIWQIPEFKKIKDQLKYSEQFMGDSDLISGMDQLGF